MAKTDLLKEAIADAKAVRETALANAKIALEEAFTPRIQSMLSAKISEEEEMEEEPAEVNGDGMDVAAGAPVGEDMEEPGMEEDYDEPGMEEDMEEPGMEEDMEEPGMEEDMEDADLDLESILGELEDDTMDEEADAELEEVSDSSDIGKSDNKVDIAYGKDQDDPGKGKLKEEAEETDDIDEDITIDEIINALQEEADDEEKPATNEGEHEDETANETADDKKDLEEAYNVIRFLKSKINEVNLLNAKLLFSNKLFRNHSLNENQKMKVIENFDRAQSLREVKLVFATLAEGFTMNGRKTKRSIKESYASKPSRSTKPKKVISEGATLNARWKKLANL